MKTPWQQCKEAVYGLKADFNEVVKTAQRVKRINSADGDVVTVYFPKIQGFEVELEVQYHKTKGAVSAKYFAFNEETDTCYIRDLLNQDLEVSGNIRQIN